MNTNQPKTAASDALAETMRSIVIDSNDLLQKSAKFAEDAAKVPSLEQKVAALSLEKTAAEQKLSATTVRINEKVAAFADKLVRHGSLTEEKKAGFISCLQEDPSQVVNVMEKLSTLAAPTEFGGGDAAVQKEARVDPIAAFCGVS